MKILFYFKKYLLGELSWDDGYVYSSNIEGEKQFTENCFSMPFYPLFSSSNKRLEKLPNIIEDYLDTAENMLIKRRAKIEESDSDFVKLYKTSTLPFDDAGFYIKAKI